jgi:hypothetical protein
MYAFNITCMYVFKKKISLKSTHCDISTCICNFMYLDMVLLTNFSMMNGIIFIISIRLLYAHVPIVYMYDANQVNYSDISCRRQKAVKLMISLVCVQTNVKIKFYLPYRIHIYHVLPSAMIMSCIGIHICVYTVLPS